MVNKRWIFIKDKGPLTHFKSGRLKGDDYFVLWIKIGYFYILRARTIA